MQILRRARTRSDLQREISCLKQDDANKDKTKTANEEAAGVKLFCRARKRIER